MANTKTEASNWWRSILRHLFHFLEIIWKRLPFLYQKPNSEPISNLTDRVSLKEKPIIETRSTFQSSRMEDLLDSQRLESRVVTEDMYLVLRRREPRIKGLSPKEHPSTRTGRSSEASQLKMNSIWQKACVALIGRPIWNPSARQPCWFWRKDPKWILTRFIKCLGDDDEETLSLLTIKDLSRAMNVIPAGAVESGVLLCAKNPSEFYSVMENPTYYSSEQQFEWQKLFPAFKSGPEAFVGVQALLHLFYMNFKALGIKLDASHGPPNVGDLVAVKTIRKLSNGDGSEQEEYAGKYYEYQMRRGVVTQVFENTISEYTVYFLDFGYEVIVSDHFLLPLLKPFHLIPPLAIRCSLFGVASIGEYWDKNVVQYFNSLLNCREAKFCFEFRSSFLIAPSHKMDLESLFTKSYMVNLEAQQFNFKTATFDFSINFAEDLIRNTYAIGWNLTPSRPKLMEGTTLPEAKGVSTRKLDRLTLPFRTALLLTKYHPQFYSPIPETVLQREIQRLFRMTGHNLTDVHGMHNRLMIVLDDPEKRLCCPSSVTASYAKGDFYQCPKEDVTQGEKKQLIRQADNLRQASNNMVVKPEKRKRFRKKRNSKRVTAPVDKE